MHSGSPAQKMVRKTQHTRASYEKGVNNMRETGEEAGRMGNNQKKTKKKKKGNNKSLKDTPIILKNVHRCFSNTRSVIGIRALHRKYLIYGRGWFILVRCGFVHTLPPPGAVVSCATLGGPAPLLRPSKTILLVAVFAIS